MTVIESNYLIDYKKKMIILILMRPHFELRKVKYKESSVLLIFSIFINDKDFSFKK